MNSLSHYAKLERVLVLILYFAITIYLLFLFHALNWSTAWRQIEIPTLSPSFADMRTIQAGLSAFEHGMNPQISNPYDPWARPMNYPSIWLLLARFLSIDKESHFLFFCLFEVFLYFCLSAFLLYRFSSFHLLLAIFSSASLFCVERGNNDLFILFLMFFVAYSKKWIALMMLTAAVSLKIYPIGYLHALIIRKNYRVFIFSAAISALILFLLRKQLTFIRTGNNAHGAVCYGFPSIPALINFYSATSGHSKLVIISFVIGSIAVLSSALIKRPIRKNIDCEALDFKLFLAGASIYVWTFAFSSSWDYRLVFLLFCFPWTYSLANRGAVIRCVMLTSMNSIWISRLGLGFAFAVFLSKVLLFVILFAILLMIQISSTLISASPKDPQPAP